MASLHDEVGGTGRVGEAGEVVLDRKREEGEGEEEARAAKRPRLGSGEDELSVPPSPPTAPALPTNILTTPTPAIATATATATATTTATTPQEPHPQKQQQQQQQPKKKTKSSRAKRRLQAPIDPCSPEDVLWHDIIDVLGRDVVEDIATRGTEREAPPGLGLKEEVEVEIRCVGSGGEGVGVLVQNDNDSGGGPAPVPVPVPWCIIVPFTLPGERVRARVYRHARLHSYADLVEVLIPNASMRDMGLVRCRYFGECAGCQYQMTSYENQLELKRSVVVKAYRNFSDLPPATIPPIGPTIGSPLQYNYRTKITPHFEAPPKSARRIHDAKQSQQQPEHDVTEGGDVKMKAPESEASEVTGEEQEGEEEQVPDWLKIGFNKIGTRKTMDIEDCPIATPVIRSALGPAREAIRKNIWSYKKGVSLLFRDSLDRSVEIPSAPSPSPPSSSSVTSPPPPEFDLTLSEAFNKHVCITNHNAIVREKVGAEGWVFEYSASSFFQNNNSVLEPLTKYVRDAIFQPWGGVPTGTPYASSSSSSSTAYTFPPSSTSSTPPTPLPPSTRPTHLVDAYCGSGLFALTLSPHFARVAGIELSTQSINAATRNAHLNHALHPHLVPDTAKTRFLAGDAADIFAVVRGPAGGGNSTVDREGNVEEGKADERKVKGEGKETRRGSPFPRERTVLVIDPPRKGCDARFLAQVVDWEVAVVVYVSCNVHTQARDVGSLIKGMQEKYADPSGPPASDPTGAGPEVGEKKMKRKRRRYHLESVRGFDLFPQTAHVESVAVLRLVDDEEEM